MGNLNGGTLRQDIALGFYNALEFNLAGRFIAGLYVGILNRDAEYAGWLFQRNAYATGFTNQNSVAANFLASPEFAQNGVLSNDNFVRLVCRQILLREASAGEVTFQSGAVNSTEFRISTGPRLTTFLLHACLLQRDPNSVERNAMIAQVNVGTLVRDLMTTIIYGTEFQGLVN